MVPHQARDPQNTPNPEVAPNWLGAFRCTGVMRERQLPRNIKKRKPRAPAAPKHWKTYCESVSDQASLGYNEEAFGYNDAFGNFTDGIPGNLSKCIPESFESSPEGLPGAFLKASRGAQLSFLESLPEGLPEGLSESLPRGN